MSRVEKDDYLARLEHQTPYEVIDTAIHTLGNRTNSIMNAADLLRMHFGDGGIELSDEKVQRMLEMISDNVQDIVHVLDALAEYNRTRR